MSTIEKLPGRDHRSLLLYVEDRCVNNQGVLNLLNLRVNEKKYPLLKINDGHGFEPWDGSHGTRLDNGKTLKDHDDIDCLDELDDLGLVEIMSLVNGIVKITEKGHEVAAELRKRKVKRNELVQVLD